MSEPVLGPRHLNRAVLGRQLLLERADLDVAGALESVGGLQTQYAPTGYVGLWSRLRRFRRDDLTRALEDRTAVQGTLMRSTIHTVSARDYWFFAAGIRRGRRDWWLRTARHDVDGNVMERVAGVLRERLAAGPARARELRELIAARGLPAIAWSGAPHWLDMLRLPPSGTWESRRADLYGLADAWLGPPTAGESEGIEHLVRRYLQAFGPAPVGDIAGWAGVPPAPLRAAASAMSLDRYRDADGRELLDLPGAPAPEPDRAAPVRFLHTWEALLLAHARRGGVLTEAHRGRVFSTRTPQSVPTFLVDGAVAGSWRWRDGRIAVEPFEALARRAADEVEAEAGRLAEFHSGR